MYLCLREQNVFDNSESEYTPMHGHSYTRENQTFPEEICLIWNVHVFNIYHWSASVLMSFFYSVLVEYSFDYSVIGAIHISSLTRI